MNKQFVKFPFFCVGVVLKNRVWTLQEEALVNENNAIKYIPLAKQTMKTIVV